MSILTRSSLREASFIILRRYLTWTVAANLVWESAQLPLYTLWTERSLAYNAFAVVHCTVGDVIIAAVALAIALGTVGTHRWPFQYFGRVLVVATIAGILYTVYSEWLNTSVRVAWSYSASMPLVPGLGTGLAPLAQWFVLPPLGLWLCRRHVAKVV